MCLGKQRWYYQSSGHDLEWEQFILFVILQSRFLQSSNASHSGVRLERFREHPTHTHRHVNRLRYIDQLITELYSNPKPSPWGIYHPMRASNNDPNAVKPHLIQLPCPSSKSSVASIVLSRTLLQAPHGSHAGLAYPNAVCPLVSLFFASSSVLSAPTSAIPNHAQTYSPPTP